MGCGGSKKDISKDAHVDKKPSDQKPEKNSNPASPPSHKLTDQAKDPSHEKKPEVKAPENHAAAEKPKEETKKPKEEPEKAKEVHEKPLEVHEKPHEKPSEAHEKPSEVHEKPHEDHKKQDVHEHAKETHDHPKKDSSKPDQAGGHAGSLIARGDKLLKKAGPKELAFYQYLFSDECVDPALVQLREIVPHFYGIEEIDGKNFMVLENLLTGYEHPNLLDCKIGKVTWTRDHNGVKLVDQQRKAQETTTGSLGFRITGLVKKDNNGETLETIMKDEGFYSINPENIHEYLQKIVGDDKHQVATFISQTEKILNWFKSQTSKVFFSASLFYVNGKNGKSQTRFIDLAYVYDAEGNHDESN